MKFQRSFFLLFLIGLLASSCADKNLIRSNDAINVAFDKAKRVFDKKEYSEAARAFETVITMARGTNYAQDAQYYLAESYFLNEEYLIAASEYQRYMNYYPRDQRREEVQFKEALSYFKMSPRYKLDQSDTHKAIELFQLFLLRYPTSDFALEAGTKINELRDKLAHKIYDAAIFYLRIGEYNAAAMYFGQVVNDYPDSSWADDAIAKQMETYNQFADHSIDEKQEERYRLAIAAYQKYLQLFPNGEHRNNLENLYDDIQGKIKSLQKAK